MRQLLRHMKAYIEKKHYHVGKKVADLGLVWHPDTLFQPNDISVGSSFFCRKYRFKHIYFQDHKPEINALQQLYIIYLFFFFLADLNIDITFAEHTCYSFFTAQKDFFSKCDQIQRKFQIQPHLPMKSSMETSFLCNICLLKSAVRKLFKFNTTAVKQSLFIHLIIALIYFF